jgi:N-acetyl sugar amidotransferase
MMKTSYQICSYCVMDTTDIQIQFNSQGICNHCLSATNLLKRLKASESKHSKSLESMISELHKHPGRDGFHAIIGVSGGIDSSYLLHALKDSGLKLLAVHVDAGWNSIQAVRNISNLVSALEIDLETVVIDWQEMKSLQVAFLKSGVPNQDVPQDHAFFGSLFNLANEYNIKFVLSGSNYATESILPMSWGQFAMDGLQLIDINKKHGKGLLKSYPVTLLRDYYVARYIKKTYTIVSPLNSLNFSKKSAIEILNREYGWIDYGGKHKESRFTDYFQEVYLPQRFGIDKKRAHLSSMIVSGEITRDEALEIIETSKISKVDSDALENFIASKLGIPISELQGYSKLPWIDPKVYRNENYLNLLLKILILIRSFLRKPKRFKGRIE